MLRAGAGTPRPEMEAPANTATKSPNGAARELVKQDTDLHLLGEWIAPGSRVLDLGCGRGLLLEHLHRVKSAQVMGVDSDLQSVIACVERGVPAYQGDIIDVLGFYPAGAFDWVVCSRTVQELDEPWRVLERALVVGRRVAVGFVNHGFWLNRWSMFMSGRRVRNEVYPEAWYKSRPSNPVSVADFEEFCAAVGARVTRRAFLAGDWRTPRNFWPELLAGYALYEFSREA
jgi:methionine biosynthesis protein MetW